MSESSSEWLQRAIDHVHVLFREAHEYADDYDTLPTLECMAATIAVLRKYYDWNRPRIWIAVNGDFVLTWDYAEKHKIYVGDRGQVECYESKKRVSQFTEKTLTE